MVKAISELLSAMKSEKFNHGNDFRFALFGRLSRKMWNSWVSLTLLETNFWLLIKTSKIGGTQGNPARCCRLTFFLRVSFGLLLNNLRLAWVYELLSRKGFGRVEGRVTKWLRRGRHWNVLTKWNRLSLKIERLRQKMWRFKERSGSVQLSNEKSNHPTNCHSN